MSPFLLRSNLLSARAVTLLVVAVTEAIGFVSLYLADYRFMQVFFVGNARRVAIAYLDGGFETGPFIAHALLESIDASFHTRIPIGHGADSRARSGILRPRTLRTRGSHREKCCPGDTRGEYVFG
jgi:hypothetical protein